MAEERIDRLEEQAKQQEVASITLVGIVEGIDRKVDELTGMAKATQIESSIIETRLTTVDRRLDAVKLDMTNSFSQLAAYQIQTEKRVEERFAQVEANRAAMETRILSAFEQVLAILDARLPAKEE